MLIANCNLSGPCPNPANRGSPNTESNEFLEDPTISNPGVSLGLSPTKLLPCRRFWNQGPHRSHGETRARWSATLSAVSTAGLVPADRTWRGSPARGCWTGWKVRPGLSPCVAAIFCYRTKSLSTRASRAEHRVQWRKHWLFYKWHHQENGKLMFNTLSPRWCVGYQLSGEITRHLG